MENTHTTCAPIGRPIARLHSLTQVVKSVASCFGCGIMTELIQKGSIGLNIVWNFGPRGIACIHVCTPLCSFTLLITKVSCGCGLWLAATIKSNQNYTFSPFKLVVCDSLSLWLMVGSIFESQPIIYSLDCSVSKVVAPSTFSQYLDLEIPYCYHILTWTSVLTLANH